MLHGITLNSLRRRVSRSVIKQNPADRLEAEVLKPLSCFPAKPLSHPPCPGEYLASLLVIVHEDAEQADLSVRL